MDWLAVLLGLMVAFSVLMYVVMDGFDLGIGILVLFAPGEAERATMINSIAPFWDGNETWLVLGGTLLIAAFPLAYATLLPAFYLPLMTMLFALVFRGIAFEFRFRSSSFRWLWDLTFIGGSMLATFCQGVVLGGFIKGVQVPDGAFGAFNFVSVFAVICGTALLAAYAMLGAAWLIFKTGGATADYGRLAARVTLPLTLALIALVSIWTPLTYPRIALRWFSWPNIAYLSPVPIATAAVGFWAWRAISGKRDWLPFLLAIVLFLLAFLGLGISLWPYAVPYTVTLWQAASSPPTLAFVGVGTAVIMPLVLAYFAFAYWVFRGKTTDQSGYGP
jgi:cytochrome d ubiquinol oxidase subunit II